MTLALTTYERNGGPVSNGQLDQNWIDIETELNAASAGVTVESWEIDSNGALIIRFSNGTTVGPFAAPAARFSHEGEYTPGKVYDVNDIVTKDGSSYIVLTLFQAGALGANGLEGHITQGRLGLLASGGGIPDAPADDGYYVRQNGEWVEASEADGLGGGMPDAPADGKTYGRQNGLWTEVVHPETAGGTGGGTTAAKWYQQFHLEQGEQVPRVLGHIRPPTGTTWVKNDFDTYVVTEADDVPGWKIRLETFDGDLVVEYALSGTRTYGASSTVVLPVPARLRVRLVGTGTAVITGALTLAVALRIGI